MTTLSLSPARRSLFHRLIYLTDVDMLRTELYGVVKPRILQWSKTLTSKDMIDIPWSCLIDQFQLDKNNDLVLTPEWDMEVATYQLFIVLLWSHCDIEYAD